MERLLGFDMQLLFDALITGINVLILFFVLSHFFLNPAREFLGKRREKIAAGLAEASGKQKEASILKNELEQRLLQVHKEADEIIEAARNRARQQEEEIIREAREETARIAQRADSQIKLEQQRALEEMRQEVAAIAASMAQKAIAGALSDKAQEALMDQILNGMGEGTWQSR